MRQVGTERFVAQRMDAALQARERNDVPTMAAELRQVLKVKPQHREAQQYLQNPFTFALAAYVQGRWHEAAALWEQEDLDRLPLNEAFLLADAYDRTGNAQRAEQVYAALVRRQPRDPNTYNGLGYFYAQRGIKLDEAARLIQKSLSLIAPGDRLLKGMVQDSLGWVYYKQGKTDLARSTIQSALALTSDEPEILYHLGVIERALGRKEDARRTLERALTTLTGGSRFLSLRQALAADIHAELLKLGVQPSAQSRSGGWREFVKNLLRALAL